VETVVIQSLITFLFQQLLGLKFLEGFRTYLGAAGLLGLTVHLLSQGDAVAAAAAFSLFLAAIGIRGAVARVEAVAKEAKLSADIAAVNAGELARSAALARAKPAADAGHSSPPFTATRLPLVLLALVLLAGGASAQQPDCRNGQCPLVLRPAATYPQPMPGPAVTYPTGAAPRVLAPGEEWFHVPGVGPTVIRVVRTVDATPTATPAAAPTAVEARPARLLRIVRDRATKQLEASGTDPAAARAMVALVSDQVLTEAAAARRLAVPAEGAVIDWVRDHQELIVALVRLLIQLALLFAAEPVALP
jgi:hypothetical protein